jgi:hypothetical protein
MQDVRLTPNPAEIVTKPSLFSMPFCGILRIIGEALTWAEKGN